MSRRLRVGLLHRIEAFEFDARIRRAKLPVHCADSLVTLILPLLRLLTEVFHGCNVVRQALPCQHAQFDLGNVEPACVLGGVMDLQPISQRFSLFRCTALARFFQRFSYRLTGNL